MDSQYYRDIIQSYINKRKALLQYDYFLHKKKIDVNNNGFACIENASVLITE